MNERPLVISVTYISTGSPAQSNVLPSEANVKGTIRSFEDINVAPPNKASIRHLLQQRIEGTAKALGVTAQLDIKEGAPATINDPKLFGEVVEPLRALWPGPLDTAPHRMMVAEDFAYYTSVVPSLYFGLGIAKDGLGNAGVHTPEFTISPDAFAEGIRLLTLAAELAGSGSGPVRQ